MALMKIMDLILMAQPAKYYKMKEMVQDPKDGQQIVRIIASRGNYLHEVETAGTETENFLAKWNKF
ncbi:putative RNA-binding protein EIF1AD isoform 2-T11 [Glossina fuscipes fuscipes]